MRRGLGNGGSKVAQDFGRLDGCIWIGMALVQLWMTCIDEVFWGLGMVRLAFFILDCIIPSMYFNTYMFVCLPSIYVPLFSISPSNIKLVFIMNII